MFCHKLIYIQLISYLFCILNPFFYVCAMEFESTFELIEASIAEIGADPILCRGDKKGQWNITYKGATIWIDLFNFSTNPEKYYFQVMSPLVRMPDRNVEAFSLNLLEINHGFYGSWISKKNDWFYVMSLREADNLDKSEVDATIDRVAFYSADYYGKLTFKYEGSWDPKANDKPLNFN
jgi:hypothetical protein